MSKSKKKNVADIIIESINEALPHITITDKETKRKYNLSFATNSKGYVKTIFCIKQKVA